jgi:hypothetical protein
VLAGDATDQRCHAKRWRIGDAVCEIISQRHLAHATRRTLKHPATGQRPLKRALPNSYAQDPRTLILPSYLKSAKAENLSYDRQENRCYDLYILIYADQVAMLHLLLARCALE